jgi:hypothetical protein
MRFKLEFIAEAINSNNEKLKMKNEKLWKGSALTRLYNAGRRPLNYSLFIFHYSFNFSLSGSSPIN